MKAGSVIDFGHEIFALHAAISDTGVDFFGALRVLLEKVFYTDTINFFLNGGASTAKNP